MAHEGRNARRRALAELIAEAKGLGTGSITAVLPGGLGQDAGSLAARAAQLYGRPPGGPMGDLPGTRRGPGRSG